MLDIYVGNSYPTDLNEADLRLLPAYLVAHVSEWIDSTKGDKSITVYTPTIINWVGECIELGTMCEDGVRVHVGPCTYGYDDRGVILGHWPHGLFNY